MVKILGLLLSVVMSCVVMTPIGYANNSPVLQLSLNTLLLKNSQKVLRL